MLLFHRLDNSLLPVVRELGVIPSSPLADRSALASYPITAATEIQPPTDRREPLCVCPRCENILYDGIESRDPSQCATTEERQQHQ